MQSALYTIWQIVWGFPQTLVGGIVYIATRPRKRGWFKGVLVSTWSKSSSISLGMFVFVAQETARHDSLSNPERTSLKRLIAHEYGHTIQSAILGPLYLLVVGLPSLIWASSSPCRIYRSRRNASYYRFFTERNANWLSSRLFHLDVPK